MWHYRFNINPSGDSIGKIQICYPRSRCPYNHAYPCHMTEDISNKLTAFLRRIAPFQWYTEDVAEATGLPMTGRVFTYHPIRFLKWMTRSQAGTKLSVRRATAEGLNDEELKAARAEEIGDREAGGYLQFDPEGEKDPEFDAFLEDEGGLGDDWKEQGPGEWPPADETCRRCAEAMEQEKDEELKGSSDSGSSSSNSTPAAAAAAAAAAAHQQRSARCAGSSSRQQHQHQQQEQQQEAHQLVAYDSLTATPLLWAHRALPPLASFPLPPSLSLSSSLSFFPPKKIPYRPLGGFMDILESYKNSLYDTYRTIIKTPYHTLMRLL